MTNVHDASSDERDLRAGLQAGVLAAAPVLLTPNDPSERSVNPLELARRYMAGETITGLAKEYGCGVTTMRAILTAGGATIRKPLNGGKGRRRRIRLRVPGDVDARSVSAAVARALNQDVDDW
jgi:hypothetical protein